MEDICYEQLIADSRRGHTVLMRTLLILGCLTLVALSLLFPIPIGDQLVPLTVFAVAISVIAVTYFWRRTAKEYEYIFTDGQFDLDVIFDKNGRKRLLSFDCRELQLLAARDEETYRKVYERKYDLELDATDRSREPEGVFVAIVKLRDGRSVKLSFQPDERLRKLFKRYAPRTVILPGAMAHPVEISQ